MDIALRNHNLVLIRILYHIYKIYLYIYRCVCCCFWCVARAGIWFVRFLYQSIFSDMSIQIYVFETFAGPESIGCLFVVFDDNMGFVALYVIFLLILVVLSVFLL